MSWGWNFRSPGGKAGREVIVIYVTVMRAPAKLRLPQVQWKPVMARHVEREQTNQVTELTADEMEGVSGGLTFELVDVKINSISVSGHDSSPHSRVSNRQLLDASRHLRMFCSLFVATRWIGAELSAIATQELASSLFRKSFRASAH
jgi:hypothetical protein